jgi:hypothetical protein
MSGIEALPVRIRNRIVQSDTGCWLWTGTVNNTYGRARIDGRARYTHRYAYEMLVGPIPDGLVLDHLCRVRLCCNPAHLEPVTDRENVARGEAPGSPLMRTGVCKRGHEVSGANVYTTSGWIECRICLIARVRAYQVRKTAEAKAARAASNAAPAEYVAEIARHGIHGYKFHGCRCETCRSASQASTRRYRQRKRQQQDARRSAEASR